MRSSGEIIRRSDSLIVLDKAGLTSTEQLHPLVKQAKQSDLRLLVDNPELLPSAEAEDAFRMLLEKYSTIEGAKVKQGLHQKNNAVSSKIKDLLFFDYSRSRATGYFTEKLTLCVTANLKSCK
ncbi:MAG: hypothetical protein PHV82_00915 [Victivallaceae bacterium]|nr:hypothetical protein [Victivallaceae bacterium]